MTMIARAPHRALIFAAVQNCTLQDIVQATGVEYAKARQALSDFVRLDHVEIIGTVRVEHSRKPVSIYAKKQAEQPAPEQDTPDTISVGFVDLNAVWFGQDAA